MHSFSNFSQVDIQVRDSVRSTAGLKVAINVSMVELALAFSVVSIFCPHCSARVEFPCIISVWVFVKSVYPGATIPPGNFYFLHLITVVLHPINVLGRRVQLHRLLQILEFSLHSPSFG